MTEPSNKCMTPQCNGTRAANLRGLCMSCYSKAKKLVENGQTTWQKLEELGLVESKHGSDPFTDAFNKLTKET